MNLCFFSNQCTRKCIVTFEGKNIHPKTNTINTHHMSLDILLLACRINIFQPCLIIVTFLAASIEYTSLKYWCKFYKLNALNKNHKYAEDTMVL